MPFRFINDHSGLPCVFLSEPGGSSAQVALLFSFMYIYNACSYCIGNKGVLHCHLLDLLVYLLLVEQKRNFLRLAKNIGILTDYGRSCNLLSNDY